MVDEVTQSTIDRLMADDDFFCERFGLPKLFDWQKLVKSCEAEIVVAQKGRQIGWSTFLNIISLMSALREPNTTVVRVSASDRQVSADAQDLMRHIPKGMTSRMSPDRIVFKNWSVISAVPPNSETIRGFRPKFFKGKIHRIVICVDEAAYTDERILKALQYAMLAAPPGSRKLYLGSTPTVASNWFHQLYLEGKNNPSKKIASFHFSSMENPLIQKEDVEYLARTKTPIEYSNEVLGEPMSSETSFFADVLEPCLKNYALGISDPDSVKVLGVDLKKFYSGGRDRHALVEFCRGAKSRLTWSKAFSYATVEELAAIIMQRHEALGYAKVVIESFDASGVFEILQRKCVPVELVTPTQPKKHEAFSYFHALAANGGLEISTEATDLIDEMKAFEFRVSSTGNISYGHPENSTRIHDDLTMAAAWALMGLKAVSYEIPEGAVASFESNFSMLEREGKTGLVRKSNIGYLGNVPGGLTSEEEAFHSKSWRRGDSDLGADDVRY